MKLSIFKFICTFILSILFISFFNPSFASPILPVITGNSAIFSQDQSDGIFITNSTTPSSKDIQVVHILGLTRDIDPHTDGVSGIYFRSVSGTNITVNSGSSLEAVTIETQGSEAFGIAGFSEGIVTPDISGIVPRDSFLDIPLIGQDPAVPGGKVAITSYGTITTKGQKADGIHVSSNSEGYPSHIINELKDFKENGFQFEVTGVTDAAGQIFDFTSSNEVTVRGLLIDAQGQPVKDSNNNNIEYGTFVIHKNGKVDIEYSTDESEALASLAEEQIITISVDYTVTGKRANQTQSDNGKLIVTLQGKGEGQLEEIREAYFETFGVSAKPSLETHATIFPDLEQYVTTLLGGATAGGKGGGVSVIHTGSIVTREEQAHGIYASSAGGQGAAGRGGSISHSADRGKDGKQAGDVCVTLNGNIETAKNNAAGIMAVSTGGQGGHGGNGGFWRYGQPGGTGGTGGAITVNGTGKISTKGDYASAIVAFSSGGDGGSGGEGCWTTSGAGGGFGGKGGTVFVDGDWDITTEGDKAHGVWAKSLGGNAGAGGSGGWLFGKPGSGGEASNGGSVTINSGADILTTGNVSYGIYAQSVGGFGGSGGTSSGLFWSFGGDANSGGAGGIIEVINKDSGNIKTQKDYSHAVFAQSIGGGGGSGGGEFGLIASLGGKGASGGDGGTVTVLNKGWLETGFFDEDTPQEDRSGKGAYGIFAQSVGGGGGEGGSVSGLVSIGGSGSQTSDGGNVTVINQGTILTHMEESHAIFAQSVGGGGGNGGRSSGLVSIGGSGGSGGNAGSVTVTNEGALHTEKEEAYGIFAQSVGGGGGNGGGAVSFSPGASISIGGKGAKGGDGQAVIVNTRHGSSIHTEDDRSIGIFAQSVGGGGGNGGYAISTGTGLTLSLGGSGGGGGMGDAVTVDIKGDVTTEGMGAHAVMAQSVGGGGGNGGFSISGSIGGGSNANIAIGGNGGTGNKGGAVAITSSGTIKTLDMDAHGIVAQSIGGSGGMGGFSIAASIGGGMGLDMGFGGNGGSGSSGGTVTVGKQNDLLKGSVSTQGDRSYGILAQSIGGGGGSGGANITGSLLSPAAITLGFGGDGGDGGFGEAVGVYSGAQITTHGLQSHGILAQSIGGGGGNGGLSISGGVTAFGGLSLSMGGDGGSGNTAGMVTVANYGNIETNDEYAYGILAQSIGGGGGNGGTAGSVMANFSSLIPIPPEYPTGSVNIAISLGGNAGDGGKAGCVYVDNAGKITTKKDYAYGVFAQSIGGGGGDGGKSIAVTANISMPGKDDENAPKKEQIEVKVDFAMAIGGKGGDGNIGNTVDVSNSGIIETSGVGAHGIFAQSVGGGGGSGGDARSMILSIDPSNWVPADPPPDPGSISFGATLSVGGDSGEGGDGGQVQVSNSGTIITHKADAYGILAQSIGGGGGLGGGGYHGLDWQDFGVSEDLEPFLELLPVQDEGDVHITVGGKGQGGGDGKLVKIDNIGDIITLGDGSIGILAQSIGGGGGLGGIGAVGGDGSVGLGGSGGVSGNGGEIRVNLTGHIQTCGIAAHGIFAQSIGGGGGSAGNTDLGITGFGIENLIGGDAGNGGDGGNVRIENKGSIITRERGAIGIFAQSVGGGGGLAGQTESGFGFAGSGGDKGNGGKVEVIHTGDITTYGDYAHGIFAQSVGGQDFGGDVVVEVDGDITVHGQGALAVIAQSQGMLGKKNIGITYKGGTITGNTASAVKLFEGLDNTFINQGTITTHAGVDGTAFLTTSGNDTIQNRGIVSGNVNLGSGINWFVNHAGAALNTGKIINLGNGSELLNQGTVSPGGNGRVYQTCLTGNFKQTSSASLMVDWDMRSQQSDFVEVSGLADLAGQTQIRLLNAGHAVNGAYKTVIVTGNSGVVDSGLSLLAPRTAVMDYDLYFDPNGTDVQLTALINTSPAGLSPSQSRMGNFINLIQASGLAENFAPIAAELFALPDANSLGQAYDQLTPASNGVSSTSSISASSQYNTSLVKRMHSVRSAIQNHDPSMAVSQVKPNALWLEGFGSSARQGTVDGFGGYDATTTGISLGYDSLPRDRLLFGISLGHSDSEVDMNQSTSRNDIESFFGSFYNSLFTDKWYVDSALSYGHHVFHNYRSVDIGGISGIAASKHDGDTLSALIEPGFTIYKGDWMFQPFMTLKYSYLFEDSYQESGLPGANLFVDSKNTQSLLMDLGLRCSRPFKKQDWVFIPEAMVALNHDFDLDDHRMVAAFDSAPTLKFTTDGRDVEQNGILAGFGFTMINKNHFSISITYNGEFRDHFIGQTLIGGIRYEF